MIYFFLFENRYSMTLSARSAALFALQRWSKTGDLVSDTIRRHSQTLLPADLRFAFDLSSGTVRQFWTIEWYAHQLVAKAIPNKPSQKLLLFMALYQRLFHENLPPHALIYEYVELAKKECNSAFAAFINAVLRKSLLTPLALPQGNSIDDLSIRYSYPPSFIRRLLSRFSLETAIRILEAENVKLPSCRRGAWDAERQQFSFDKPFDDEPYVMQNPTQPTIFADLSQRVSHPQRILDLCAGAGGKSLMAWEIFHPQKLLANDLSSHRLERLKEEGTKHRALLDIVCGDASLLPEEEKFDLVIVDPPCSNSGVLFKCPEARHRLDDNTIRHHLALEELLLRKSQRLLSPRGVIFYSTCSILREENEEMVASVCSSLPLTMLGPSILILPDKERFEGGFGAALQALE